MPVLDPAANRPPQARRLPRARWTDPRLLAGIVIVAISVVVGARVVAANDARVAVWALRADADAGSTPSVQDLHQVRVQLDDTTQEHYVTAATSGTRLEELLAASEWAHDVRAGELLAESALVVGDVERAAELPLRVESGSMPADTSSGEAVDVWVSPDAKDPLEAPVATRVLQAVQVLSVRERGTALAEGGTQVVLVAVDRRTADFLDDVLAAIDSGHVTLVRVAAPGSST